MFNKPDDNDFIEYVTKLPELNNLEECQKPDYDGDELYIDTSGEVKAYSNIDEPEFCSVPQKDGMFIGINRGEFDGKLLFLLVVFPEPFIYTVFADNTHYIFAFHDQICVLTGLDHLGTHRGHLLILQKNKSMWEVKTKFDLESMPNVYTIIDDNLYIFTGNNIWVYDGKHMRKEYEKPPCEFWYLNSVFAGEKYIYLAGRGTIYKIDKETIDVKLYRQKKDSMG